MQILHLFNVKIDIILWTKTSKSCGTFFFGKLTPCLFIHSTNKVHYGQHCPNYKGNQAINEKYISNHQKHMSHTANGWTKCQSYEKSVASIMKNGFHITTADWRRLIDDKPVLGLPPARWRRTLTPPLGSWALQLPPRQWRSRKYSRRHGISSICIGYHHQLRTSDAGKNPGQRRSLLQCRTITVEASPRQTWYDAPVPDFRHLELKNFFLKDTELENWRDFEGWKENRGNCWNDEQTQQSKKRIKKRGSDPWTSSNNPPPLFFS